MIKQTSHTMQFGTVPRDAVFSHLRGQNTSAKHIQSETVSTDKLYIQGRPFEEYLTLSLPQTTYTRTLDPIHSIHNIHSTHTLENAETTETIETSETETESESEPEPEVRQFVRDIPSTYTQVSLRAQHATTSDEAFGFHDPVNGKRGHVLTSDEFGKGSWQPLPPTMTVAKPALHCLSICADETGTVWQGTKIQVQHDNQLQAGSITLTEGAVEGWILTSDAQGHARWAPCLAGEVHGPLQSRTGSLAIFSDTTGVHLDTSDLLWNSASKTLCVPTLQLTENPQGLLMTTSQGQVTTVPWGPVGSVALSTGSGLLWKQIGISAITSGHLVCKGSDDTENMWMDSGVFVSQTGHLHASCVHIDSVQWNKPLPKGSILASVSPERADWVSWSDLLPNVICASAQTVTPGTLAVYADDTGQVLTEAPATLQVTAQGIAVRDLAAKDGHMETLIAGNITAQNITATEFRLCEPAEAGYVLTADSSGTGSWKPCTSMKLPQVTRVNSIPVYGDTRGRSLLNSTLSVSAEGFLESARFVSAARVVLAQGTKGLLGAQDETLLLGLQHHSIAAGEQALASVESTEAQIAIGASALQEVRKGRFNVAVGYSALRHTQTHESVAVGVRALMNNVKGKGNVAVGYSALQTNELGHYNTALGHKALTLAQSSTCTAVGAGALMQCSIGSGNTALGAGAGDSIDTGQNNTVLGDGAGPVKDLSHCICIGKGARALYHGHLSLGSAQAPLKLSDSASAGCLSGLNPERYLPCHINGQGYKLALYRE